MSDLAIKSVNLAKMYQIQPGESKLSKGTLQEELVGITKRVFSSNWREKQILWALKNISFEIQNGEIVGVIGHNGAGKSTLLKILSRITEPTSGYVDLYGRVGSLLEVGTGFHTELTGRENIFLSGAVLGMTRAEIKGKFDEIVDFSDVENFLNTPVKRFSTGMKVRLAFSVAAHLEPEILLIDEVLAVGDLEFQKKCLGKMDEVASGGRTVLFVSHNMGYIQNLCPTTLLLNRGIIEEYGKTKSVINTYVTSIDEPREKNLDLEFLPRKRNLGTDAKLTNCTILDSKHEENSKLLFGEPFSLKLHIKSFHTVQELGINIGINSIPGQRITTAHSRDANKVYSVQSGEVTEIQAAFDSLKLVPGRYWLSLELTTHGNLIDVIQNVIYFDVLDSYFEGYHFLTQRKGPVFVQARWS